MQKEKVIKVLLLASQEIIVSQIEEVAAEFETSASEPSSSSTDPPPTLAAPPLEPPPPLEEVAVVSDDGLVTMSKMGYVRSRRPPHNDSYTCGLICKYHSAARIAASCHLHTNCATQLGNSRGDDVPRIRLAEWLASGRKMRADATKEER